MTSGAINAALQGMQFNQARFQQSAHQISRFETGEDVNLAQEMTGLLTAREGYQANLRVLQTSGEMLGSLIDTLA